MPPVIQIPDRMNNWISIFETDQLYKAELVKSVLCDNGVEAVILNQKDSSYNTFGTIQVMVSRDHKDQAEEIIKSIHCE